MKRRHATQLMGALFAVGSACFLVGPFPGYLELVGPQADAATFFAGSLFFTAGGAVQSTLAFRGPRADRWAALVQSAGTLFFNVTTFRALDATLANPDYDRLVWRPDALGSVCFLISGLIAYRAARGDRQAAVNLLGCVLFGVAAVAGYVVPGTGSMLDLAAANWTTSLGAACFLVCAVGTLRSARRGRAPSPDREDARAAPGGESRLVTRRSGTGEEAT